MPIKTKNFKIKLNVDHGLGVYYGLPTDKKLCHLKLNKGIKFLKNLGFNLSGTTINALGANSIIHVHDIANFIKYLTDPESVAFKSEAQGFVIDLMRIELMTGFNSHDKKLVNSFKSNPLKIFKALTTIKDTSINPKELAKSRSSFKSWKAYQKYWLKEFPWIKSKLSGHDFDFLDKIKITRTKKSAKPKINLRAKQDRALTSFYNQFKIINHRCWLNYSTRYNHLITRHDKKEFIKASDDLRDCFKLDINDEGLIQVIANSMSRPDGCGPDDVSEYMHFVEDGGKRTFKEVGIGNPKLAGKLDFKCADVLLKLYHQEISSINKIHKLQSEAKFGAKGADDEITSLYFKIKKNAYNWRKYGAIFQQNHVLNKKEYINLAELMGVLIPNHAKIKWNIQDRLDNLLNFASIKYSDFSDSDKKLVVYDPLDDSNHGQWLIDDTKVKQIIAMLNPGSVSYQKNELFKALPEFVNQEFKQHSKDQNLIVFNNGVFNRISCQLRPIKASDQITLKLAANFDSKWLSHLPNQKFIKNHGGFYKAALLLAKDYHPKTKIWHKFEYPFSRIHNKNIRKLNPYKYLYHLANKDSKRFVTLFQILLDLEQDLFDHHKLILLTGSGARGKSLFLSIPRNIIGHANYASVSLSDLGNPNGRPFATASLPGKIADIADEATPSGFLGNNSLIKILITKDGPIPINQKFVDDYKISMPYLTLAFSSNWNLRVKDDPKAVNRRLLEILFKNRNITKFGNAQFGNVIRSKPVVSFFAAMIAAKVPSFNKFTVSDEDRKHQEKQTGENNSVFEFIKKELMPTLRLNRKKRELMPYFLPDEHYKPLLTSISKQVIQDWYYNYTKNAGEKPVKSLNFFKKFKAALNIGTVIPNQAIKNKQLTIDIDSVDAYKKMAKDDKFMPMSRKDQHNYRLKSDNINEDRGQVKRCYYVDPTIPLINSTDKDKQLMPKFKAKLDQLSPYSYVYTKKDKNANLIVNRITQGLACVNGTLKTKSNLCKAKNLWIPLSELIVKKTKQAAKHHYQKNNHNKLKAKILNNAKKTVIKEVSLSDFKVMQSNCDLTKIQLDDRELVKTLDDIKLSNWRSKMRDLYLKLYQPRVEDIIFKFSKIDTSEEMADEFDRCKKHLRERYENQKRINDKIVKKNKAKNKK